MPNCSSLQVWVLFNHTDSVTHAFVSSLSCDDVTCSNNICLLILTLLFKVPLIN